MSEDTEIAIPENVGDEIKRMHGELVAAARTFEEKRAAFGEYIRIAKQTLLVPNDGWGIKEDASAFIEVPEEK